MACLLLAIDGMDLRRLARFRYLEPRGVLLRSWPDVLDVSIVMLSGRSRWSRAPRRRCSSATMS